MDSSVAHVFLKRHETQLLQSGLYVNPDNYGRESCICVKPQGFMIQSGFSSLKIWRQSISNLRVHMNYMESVERQILTSTYGGGLRACISHKLPGEAGAPGPQMHLKGRAAEAAAQIIATWQSSQGS